jgi:hypothetical protein
MLILNHTVDVYNPTQANGSQSYPAEPTHVGLACGIHPSNNPNLQISFPDVPASSLFELFFEEALIIQTGTKLVEGDKTWVVKGQPQVWDLAPYTYAVLEQKWGTS